MATAMKVIPQINVFSINIELKVLIGLGLLLEEQQGHQRIEQHAGDGQVRLGPGVVDLIHGLIGLGLLLLLVAPFSEFLLAAELDMLESLDVLLTLAG